MIERFIEKKLILELNNDYILTMIGARQVGKTTLLNKIKKYLLKKKAVVNLFTLEDKTLLADLNTHPKNIFNYIDFDADKQFLLIDEIQYLDDPSNFLKYIYDLYNGKIKLVVTGSSAFYIDKKYKDSLAGRKKIIHIRPFTFSEFLLAKNAVELSKKINEFSYFNKQKEIKLLIPEKDK
ncbi:MAG: ATP-binding protein, partial [Bacteroidetes bacterium]